MYFSKTVVVSSLVSLALAADHQPVTIEDFDPSYDVKCGSVTVKGRDIYNSIAWGMSLNQAGEGLVSSEGTATRISLRLLSPYSQPNRRWQSLPQLLQQLRGLPLDFRQVQSSTKGGSPAHARHGGNILQRWQSKTLPFHLL
jgi:hypothetical protein